MGDDWTNEVAGCVRLLTAGGSSLCSGEWSPADINETMSIVD
jgi:hypothetical protein